ncbi:MAG: tetratricopeptide repeat protein [Candidatus Firestonebacteria bacterium]|nr:tetratricopeptide repeat protein [Candidatus Firestonebacteria bacterium]
MTYQKTRKYFFLFIIISSFIYSGCSSLRKQCAEFHFKRGNKKIQEGKYLSAINNLIKVEKYDDERKNTPESLLLIGKAYFQYSIIYRNNNAVYSNETKEMYNNYLKKSEEYLTRLIKEYPKHNLADDAQYNIGLIYDWDQLGGTNIFEKALVEYQKVIDLYPGSSSYPFAKERIKIISAIIKK